MDRRSYIELIMLEVLGCLDEKNQKNLQLMKETDENFPWKDLGRYQNFVAFLPLILKSADVPSASSKDIMVNKLNQLIHGESTINLAMKSVPEKEKTEVVHSEKILSRSKIDWGSLSSFDSLPAKTIEIKEVKPKQRIDEEHLFRMPEAIKVSDDKELMETSFEQTEVAPTKVRTLFSKKIRYVLISVILILMTAIIFTYIHFKNIPESIQITEETQNSKTNLVPKSEIIKTDSAINFNNIVDEGGQEQETQNVTEKQENVLPKSPPSLPEPIVAPLGELQEISATEENNIGTETTVPPPQEETEVNEEPTYFIAVEEMPEPIGGLQDIQSRIQYPEIAKRAGIEGKVFVRAFVDETGTVTNAEVVKGIGGGCDEAALDAILKTKFSPGKQRGRPIKVQVTIPIIFKR